MTAHFVAMTAHMEAMTAHFVATTYDAVLGSVVEVINLNPTWGEKNFSICS